MGHTGKRRDEIHSFQESPKLHSNAMAVVIFSAVISCPGSLHRILRYFVSSRAFSTRYVGLCGLFVLLPRSGFWVTSFNEKGTQFPCYFSSSSSACIVVDPPDTVSFRSQAL